MDPLLVAAAFPGTFPNWDFNMAEGKENLFIYRQALLTGLKATARRQLS